MYGVVKNTVNCSSDMSSERSYNELQLTVLFENTALLIAEVS